MMRSPLPQTRPLPVGRTHQRWLIALVTVGIFALTACGGSTETASVSTSSISESDGATTVVSDAESGAETTSADASTDAGDVEPAAPAAAEESAPTDPADSVAAAAADVTDAAAADVAAPATDTAPAADAATEAEAAPAADTATEAEAAVVSLEEAAEIAAVNEPTIVGGDNWRTSEVLDVSTGAITTLTDVVDGDRPVLVWFYAPH